MQTEKLEDFFHLWKPLQLEKADRCPPDGTLADCALEGVPPEWQSHMEECQSCAAIVALLKDTTTSPGSRLEALIGSIKQETAKAASERPSPQLAWASFARMRLARQVAFSFGVVALAVALGWQFVDVGGLLGAKTGITTANLPADEYEEGIQLLQATVEGRAVGGLGGQGTPTEVSEVEKLLARLGPLTKSPQQRATLANLVVAYITRVEGQAVAQAPSQLAQSPYSREVADLYSTIGGTQPTGVSGASSSTGRAEAVRSGMEQARVVEIREGVEGPGAPGLSLTTFVLEDRVALREPLEVKQLELRVMGFAERHKAAVHFVDFGGSGPKTFAPSRQRP